MILRGARDQFHFWGETTARCDRPVYERSRYTLHIQRASRLARYFLVEERIKAGKSILFPGRTVFKFPVVLDTPESGEAQTREKRIKIE